MEDSELREEISDLEQRGEALAESAQRCRKLLLASKIYMLAGGVLILAGILDLLAFSPLAMIVATTAIIAGIVVFGSTTTTAKQISADMQDAEARRAELIEKLALRVVEDRAPRQDRRQGGPARRS